MRIRLSLLLVLVATLLTGCGGGSSSSQSVTPPPTPNPSANLGTVSNVNALPTCPAGYDSGAQCWQATVSCSGTADIQVTYGFLQASGTPKGTIVLFGGGTGTQPFSGSYNQLYAQAGYSLVASAWASAWEDTGLSQKNIGTAACRPATLLNYIFQNVASPGAKCAQGFSGGSAAVAYALAWYGAPNYLDKVELVSGPVFSDIEQGCVVPQPPPLTVCPQGQFGCVAGDTFQDSPSYTPGSALAVGQMSGDASCGGASPTSAQSNANWKAMSIVDGTAKSTFVYPKTSVAGWVCDNGLNNSAAQGDIFYQQFTDASQTANFMLTPIKNCTGAEGVDLGQTPTGLEALSALSADMTDPVNGCVVHPR